MRTPLFSILVLTHNFERYVADALESIGQQTHSDYEVVVADDGSTDATRKIVEAFASTLPIKVVTGPNIGIGRNWERAMPHCRGSLFVLLSGDDRLRPEHLANAAEALTANPNAALAYSEMIAVDESGVAIDVPPTRKTKPRREGRVDPLELLRWNYIGGSGVVMRRDAVEAVGGIDPNLVFVDLDLFVRIAARYEIALMPGRTVEYRVRAEGLHTDYDANLSWRLAMYEKHLGSESADTKRSYVADAHMKTAYKQLWPSPTRGSVRQARRNLVRAARTSPRRVAQPLGALMFAAACAGPVWVYAANRSSRKFSTSRLKLYLQRRLGIASADDVADT